MLVILQQRRHELSQAVMPCMVMGRERQFCTVVRGIRGACCWSTPSEKQSEVKPIKQGRRGNVKWRSLSLPHSYFCSSSKREWQRDAFQQRAVRSKSSWPSTPVERNWKHPSSASLTQLRSAYGTESQPDWFMDTLMPLIIDPNRSAHARILKTNDFNDR